MNCVLLAVEHVGVVIFLIGKKKSNLDPRGSVVGNFARSTTLDLCSRRVIPPGTASSAHYSVGCGEER